MNIWTRAQIYNGIHSVRVYVSSVCVCVFGMFYIGLQTHLAIDGIPSIETIWPGALPNFRSAETCWEEQSWSMEIHGDPCSSLLYRHVGGSIHGGTPTSSYKPSILGYPHLWKPPYTHPTYLLPSSRKPWSSKVGIVTAESIPWVPNVRRPLYRLLI